MEDNEQYKDYSAMLGGDAMSVVSKFLNVGDLFNWCATSKSRHSICFRDDVWKAQTYKDFTEKEVKPFTEITFDLKKGYIPHKELYILLYNLKRLKNKLLPYAKYLENTSLFDLYTLESLSISDTDLIELPPEIGNLVYLRELYLDNNQIVALPSEIGNLINLRFLNLEYNKIKELPSEVGNLVNLRELWLDGNELTNLPKEMSKLTNLQKLFVAENKLTEIPEEFQELKSLKYLNVEDNEITKMPKNIKQLMEPHYIGARDY